jgi:chromosomal replication initiator protein
MTEVAVRPDAHVFNPKYTFESFVVGSCNELAYATSRAVVTSRCRAYNPLYLYGGVGIGKTHLMQAIGRELRANWQDTKVIYMLSEQFINEMIDSLRYNKMTSFHERFRSVGALLVDDIHVLSGKERTQEEFFHTFNTLYELGKQIVISSDCPPREISSFADRLRSRFEGGLVAEIGPLDLETKIAILDRKATERGIRLPEAVRTLLATEITSNVRELEGVLLRLAALASLTGAEINISLAQHALESIVLRWKGKITLDMIQKAVGEEFSLTLGQLKEKTNAKMISYARQIAMYLAKELTPASLCEIARAFGGKHHTTVLYSVSKIENIRRTDGDLNRLIHKLMDSLKTSRTR